MQSSTATWSVSQVGKPAAGQGRGRETFGRVGQPWIVVVARANRGVRAHHHAVSALDAQLRLPDRDAVGDVRFSHRAVGRGIRAIHGKGADGSSLPRPAIIMAVTCLTNSGACAGTRGRIARAGRRGRQHDFMQVLERAIDGREIALDQSLPLRVRRLDGL